MLADANPCFTCTRFRGVKQDREQEETERYVCDAFPNGVPFAIAFGPNQHAEPYPGDRGIQYERAER